MFIALCSLKSSPGVTTLAVALGAVWPEPATPVVVEADPAGGDLVARWRLPETPSVVSLAAAARRADDSALVMAHTQRLPGGLRVVPGPIGPGQARAALAALSATETGLFRKAADLPGIAVIADCGRIDAGSVPSLLRSTDVTLLIVRPRDDELARVALQLTVVQHWCPQIHLVLAGDGYRTSDVAQVLGVPILARIPHDPKNAALMNGHGGSRSAPARSGLGKAAHQIASFLTTMQPPRAVDPDIPMISLQRATESTAELVNGAQR